MTETRPITRRTGRRGTSEETKDLVVRLYNEDQMTCKQIAAACNVSETTVYNIIRERRG